MVPHRFPILLLACVLMLALATVADADPQARPPAEPLGAPRVWLIDGAETYFTIYPLLRRDDVPLTYDQVDSLTWNNALRNAREVLRKSGGGEVIVVGAAPAGLVGRALSLENEGAGRVSFEPDAWTLVQRDLTERHRDLTVLWVGDARHRGMAAHAAGLRSEGGRTVLAVSDAARMDWLVSTGLVTGIYSVGGSAPASVHGRRDIPHLGRLERLGDLVAFGFGPKGDAPPPPAAPPGPLPLDGSRFTLAVWSGIPGYLDFPLDSPQERPLSFYSSEMPATELCRGRSTCIVASLQGDICPDFPLCQGRFDPLSGGWLSDPQADADRGIASLVNAFNDDLVNIQRRWEITNLAIVSHPLDLPYRNHVLPYTFCRKCSPQPCIPVPNCGFAPPEVDCLATDNTSDPVSGLRDGNCDLFNVRTDGVFDGGTGSADFEFADVESDQDRPPTADLAFGRIMGQDLNGAMTHVATVRSVIFGTAPIPRGAAVVAGHPTDTTNYDIVSSLFDDFYGQLTQEPCEPKLHSSCPNPTIPCRSLQQPPPFCPTSDFSSDPMNYNLDTHWLLHLTPAPTGGDMELGDIRTHQTYVPEPWTNLRTPQEHFTTPCPGIRPIGCDPVPPNLCHPKTTHTDRHKIEFIKHVDPDGDAPMYSSELVRQRQASPSPFDDVRLTPGHWTMKCTACGTYNYVDHWYPPEEDFPDDCDAVNSLGQKVKKVRDTWLGPDSSFASTLIPAGLASYNIHLSVNFQQLTGQVYTPAKSFSRYYRDLFLGATLGEAERNMANFRSSFHGESPYPGVSGFFVSDNYLVGEPNVALHRQGAWGASFMRILAAPGPGSTSNHPATVRGFDRTGTPLLTFTAFPNVVPQFGCNVTGGNIDTSARDEILAGSGYGDSILPLIRGFDDDGVSIPTIYFTPAAGVGNGANVAVVDVDNDEVGEIFFSPGPSSVFGPQVRGYEINHLVDAPIPMPGINFFAFPGSNYGAHVAGGRVLRRQGTRGQLVVTRGADPAFGPDARVFYLTGPGPVSPVLSAVQGSVFLPGAFGAHVAVGDVDGGNDGYDDLLFGAGPGPTHSAALVGYAGGRDDALTQAPFISSADVYADGGLYGLRLGVSNLDLDAPKEILAGRGWDPSQSLTNSLVLGLDYQGTPTPARILAFQAFTPDTGAGAGGTGGGVSVAGMDLGNVPNLPADPVEEPIDILPPIEGIGENCPELTLSEGGASRARLRQAVEDVRDAVLTGNIGMIRGSIVPLRQVCDAEIVCPFLRQQYSVAVDGLEASVDLLEANRPPVAVIEGPSGAVCPGLYTFSGQASSDPDLRPLFRNEIQTYEWTFDGGIPEAADLETNPDAITIEVAEGTHTIELTVVDSFGAADTATFTIEAVDDEAPTATVAMDPTELWPPNHRMVPILVDVQPTDACGLAFYRLLGVTSDEPETGCGSGNHAPDVQGVDVGQPDTEFEVRAERCGNGDGRTYTAVYEVYDPSGNSTMVSATITVPHDRR